MLVVPTVDDVVNAYSEIEKAWENYRTTLRACLAEGEAEGIQGRQAEISRRLGRTREAIRQDAMTHEQREQLRKIEADRRRNRRADG
jgi:hypothetical protein